MVASQAKLRALQRVLHDLTDELTLVWQEMSTKGGKRDKDRAQENEEEVEEEEEEIGIQPKKWEEEVRRLLGIVARCIGVYAESRQLLATEFIM